MRWRYWAFLHYSTFALRHSVARVPPCALPNGEHGSQENASPTEKEVELGALPQAPNDYCPLSAINSLLSTFLARAFAAASDEALPLELLSVLGLGLALV
jgi:hypothetical protein